MPGVAIVVPPPAITVGSDVPGIVMPDATQAGLELSAGAGSIGLMPAPPSSVEPSGMVLPPGDDAVVIPEVDEACVPDTVPPDGTETHDPDIAPLIPPPSKVELDPAVPEPPIVGTAVEDIPGVPHGDILAVEPSGAGLRPPGTSSVEPNGIPAGPAEPGLPNGDVMPIPGDVMPIPGEAADPVGATCDNAGTAPRSRIAPTIGEMHFFDVLITRPPSDFPAWPNHHSPHSAAGAAENLRQMPTIQSR
jgi:hypothetical protein